MAENIHTTQLPNISVKDKSPKDLWQTYLGTLKQENANTYQKYLVDSWVMNSVSGVMVIGVSSQDSVDWLADRLSAPAVRFLNGISLGEIHQIIFVFSPQTVIESPTKKTLLTTIDPPIIESKDKAPTNSENIPQYIETVVYLRTYIDW